jgi:hypothetical protein
VPVLSLVMKLIISSDRSGVYQVLRRSTMTKSLAICRGTSPTTCACAYRLKGSLFSSEPITLTVTYLRSCTDQAIGAKCTENQALISATMELVGKVPISPRATEGAREPQSVNGAGLTTPGIDNPVMKSVGLESWSKREQLRSWNVPGYNPG